MSNIKKKISTFDSKRINIHEIHEMNYRTKAPGVPRDKLIETVQKFGI